MPHTHYNLRARLADKTKPFLFSWMSIASVQLSRQLAMLPFDGVCLDLQHGLISFSDANAMIAAINDRQRPAIVRALWNEPGLIGQALDAGAAAIIAPMVNTKEQAQALVQAAKYPPHGKRSWGGYSALQASGLSASEYLTQANQLSQVFAMIETKTALENLTEIAAVPGLDGLFVGPNDLSIALSQGAEINKFSESLLAAMASVVQAADKNGLIAGAYAGSAEAAKAYLAKGFSFIAAISDVDLMHIGAKTYLQSLS